MPRRTIGYPAALLLAALLPACATRAGDPGSPDGPSDPGEHLVTLEVTNRSSSDMDVYMIRSGQRIRLGLAPSGETTRFGVTRAQLAGGGLVRFAAVPFGGGGGEAASSDQVIVRAGMELTLDIPPP